MKKRLFFIFLFIVFVSFTGCGKDTQIPSSKLKDEQETVSSSTTREERLALQLGEAKAELEKIKAEEQLYINALDEQLENIPLKLNERYCFLLDNNYIIAGGSIYPVTDREEICNCYNAAFIPEELEGLKFDNAHFTLEDNPRFTVHTDAPDMVEIGTIETIELSPNKILAVNLRYKDASSTLDVKMYRSDFDPLFPAGLSTDHEYQIINIPIGDALALRWENGRQVYYIISNDKTEEEKRAMYQTFENQNISSVLTLN